MTTSTSTSAPVRRSVVSLGTGLRAGVVAGVVAAVTNVAISAIARGTRVASDDFVPLSPGPVVMWTMLGAVIGAVGWRLVVNASGHSRAVLATLVPTVLVLSFVPDVALLATDSVPGQTTTAVATLMVMHVVTAAVAVTVYRKVMPPS